MPRSRGFRSRLSRSQGSPRAVGGSFSESPGVVAFGAVALSLLVSLLGPATAAWADNSMVSRTQLPYIACEALVPGEDADITAWSEYPHAAECQDWEDAIAYGWHFLPDPIGPYPQYLLDRLDGRGANSAEGLLEIYSDEIASGALEVRDEAFGTFYHWVDTSGFNWSYGVDPGGVSSLEWGYHFQGDTLLFGTIEQIALMRETLAERIALLEQSLIGEGPLSPPVPRYELSEISCEQLLDPGRIAEGFSYVDSFSEPGSTTCLIGTEGSTFVGPDGSKDLSDTVSFSYEADPLHCYPPNWGHLRSAELERFVDDGVVTTFRDEFGELYVFGGPGLAEVVPGETTGVVGVLVDRDLCMYFRGWPEQIRAMQAFFTNPPDPQEAAASEDNEPVDSPTVSVSIIAPEPSLGDYISLESLVRLGVFAGLGAIVFAAGLLARRASWPRRSSSVKNTHSRPSNPPALWEKILLTTAVLVLSSGLTAVGLSTRAENESLGGAGWGALVTLSVAVLIAVVTVAGLALLAWWALSGRRPGTLKPRVWLWGLAIVIFTTALTALGGVEQAWLPAAAMIVGLLGSSSWRDGWSAVALSWLLVALGLTLLLLTSYTTGWVTDTPVSLHNVFIMVTSGVLGSASVLLLPLAGFPGEAARQHTPVIWWISHTLIWWMTWPLITSMWSWGSMIAMGGAVIAVLLSQWRRHMKAPGALETGTRPETTSPVSSSPG